MSQENTPRTELITSVPGIESRPVPRGGEIVVGSSVVRKVVILESHPNPSRVVGHPANPLTNQAEAYANYLKEANDD